MIITAAFIMSRVIRVSVLTSILINWFWIISESCIILTITFPVISAFFFTKIIGSFDGTAYFFYIIEVGPRIGCKICSSKNQDVPDSNNLDS